MNQNKNVIKCVLTKRVKTNSMLDACHKLLLTRSPWSLCGLVVKHRSAEIGRSEVQRLVTLSHAHGKTIK